MVRIFDMTGNQGSSPISKTVEKVFDDSQYTGEIILSGRNLKEYPLCSGKYDLIDTTLTDLSKNRFSDIPFQVFDYHSLEHLNCYQNVIKSLPFPITQLQNLVHLNLSRNLLTVLPPFLCQLEQLQVLHVSNNRMVSLPEEIGQLQHLMELDVSSNEITHLPGQLGELVSLRSLNLRRNLLVELPLGLCRLRLCRLDFSCNRIAHIPCDFHKMDTLEELCIDNNPLLSPPANACTKGLVHIRKFLSMEALRHERKRGVIQNDINLRNSMMNKRFSSLSTVNSDEINGRQMIDSGYCTADSSLKSFNSLSEDTQRQKLEESRKKRSDQMKMWETEKDERRKGTVVAQDELPLPDRNPKENGNLIGHNIRCSPSQSVRESHKISSPVVVPCRRLISDPDSNMNRSAATELRTQNDGRNPEIGVSINVANISTTTTTATQKPTAVASSLSVDRAGAIPIPVHHSTSVTNSTSALPLEEELRRRHDALIAQHRREAINVQQRLEEDKRLRQMVGSKNSNTLPRQGDDSSSSSSSCRNDANSFSETSKTSISKTSLPPACVQALAAMSNDLINPIFTIRRTYQQVQEDREQIEQLRNIIEKLLKVKLPDDLPGALKDGVVLCHLANHVRPRSVATIHVPSPASPNLSLAKCQRNVENFLIACRRLGIDQSMCTASDILEERGIVSISMTVQALVGQTSSLSSQQSVV